jgi:predicted Rossmann fold nucleotide-binding protein DprA/Smf involved in DNA uptake
MTYRYNVFISHCDADEEWVQRDIGGLWQDQIAPQPDLATVLEALGATDGPCTVADLAAATGLTEERVQDALSVLQRRDLVRLIDGARLDILMPLLRRWLRLRKALPTS